MGPTPAPIDPTPPPFSMGPVESPIESPTDLWESIFVNDFEEDQGIFLGNNRRFEGISTSPGAWSLRIRNKSYSKLVNLIFLIFRNCLSRSCFKGGVWKSETVSIWKLNLTASSMLE